MMTPTKRYSRTHAVECTELPPEELEDPLHGAWTASWRNEAALVRQQQPSFALTFAHHHCPSAINGNILQMHVHNSALKKCSRRHQTSPRSCHLANWTKHTRRLCSIMWKHDVIYKTGSRPTNCRQSLRWGSSNGQGWHVQKFGEIWTCGFWDMRASRLTNKQTDIHADRNISHTCRVRRWKMPSSSLYCSVSPDTLQHG